MAISDLFRPVSTPVPLWSSTAERAVIDSFWAARRASDASARASWAKLRDFLDGVHRAHTEAHAAVSHPQDSRDWALGDGHAYRFIRLVEMLAERLSVIFHRPPELSLHAGDGVPLTVDHPTYGPAVEQWHADEEFAQLSTLLPSLDQSVNVLGQQIVSPCWIADGDYSGIRWCTWDPQDVYVDQSRAMPSEIAIAQAVALEIQQPLDGVGASRPPLWSTWIRRVEAGATVYEHWVHDERGALAQNPLFPTAAPANPYGAIPVVLWQSRTPSPGSIWIPPDEALIQAQLGTNIALTDLAHGLKYAAHPSYVGKGQRPEEMITIGPGRVQWLPEDDSSFESITPTLNTQQVIQTVEWLLKVEATSRALPPDLLSPSAARNLSALQEQRHDLKVRREKVVPFYQRALRRTFDAHRIVGNYWAANGHDRAIIPPELRLGVRLAPIPKIEDRWQAAQSRQIELQQGIASQVEEIMDREGVDRAEARRRLDTRLEESARVEPEPGDQPSSKPPGDQPRPASVERG